MIYPAPKIPHPLPVCATRSVAGILEGELLVREVALRILLPVRRILEAEGPSAR